MSVAAGVLVWALAIALPLAVLSVAGVRPVPAEWAGAMRPGLLLRSFALPAGIAVAAVVLGYVPGRLLGTARRGQGAILAALLVPLLLPRYVLHYALSLLLTTPGPMEWLLGSHPDAARLVGSAIPVAVLVMWYWPLAALLIGQGWRTIDAEALRAGRLDAGPARRLTAIVLPLLRRDLALALGVCFALAMSEYATYHLAGVETLSTALSDLYEMTGSAGAIRNARNKIIIGKISPILAILTMISAGSALKN